eukprot:scaffold195666_cov36-Cyclotella_meneghiniana.AAC.4
MSVTAGDFKRELRELDQRLSIARSEGENDVIENLEKRRIRLSCAFTQCRKRKTLTEEDLSTDLQDYDDLISMTEKSGQSEELIPLLKTREQISVTLDEFRKLAKRMKGESPSAQPSSMPSERPSTQPSSMSSESSRAQPSSMPSATPGTPQVSSSSGSDTFISSGSSSASSGSSSASIKKDEALSLKKSVLVKIAVRVSPDFTDEVVDSNVDSQEKRLIQWFLNAKDMSNDVHWSLDSTSYIASNHSRHDGYSSSQAFRDLCASLQVHDGEYGVICIAFSQLNRIGVQASELKTIERKLQACCKKSDVVVYCLDALGKNLNASAEVVGTKYRTLQEISEKYSHMNPGKMGHCRKEDLDRLTSITNSANKIYNEMLRGGKLPPTLTQGVKNGQQFIEQIAGTTVENCVKKLKELVKSVEKEEVDAFGAAKELIALYKETDSTEYHLATTRSSPDPSSIHIGDVQIWQGSLVQAFINENELHKTKLIVCPFKGESRYSVDERAATLMLSICTMKVTKLLLSTWNRITADHSLGKIFLEVCKMRNVSIINVLNFGFVAKDHSVRADHTGYATTDFLIKADKQRLDEVAKNNSEYDKSMEELPVTEMGNIMFSHLDRDEIELFSYESMLISKCKKG